MKYFQQFIATQLIWLWIYLVYMNPREPLIVGAMIGIVSGSIVGFYFGATKAGSDTATKNAETVTAAARVSEPQSVIVENSDAEPIPVAAK